jgi:hypothetical protein
MKIVYRTVFSALVFVALLNKAVSAQAVPANDAKAPDAFAHLKTDLQAAQDSAAIARRMFQDFPSNVWKAEPTGQPRVISKTDTEATVGITVQISCDQTKYAQWLKTVTPFLARLATKSEQRRLNPKDAGFVALDQIVSHFNDGSEFDSLFFSNGGYITDFKAWPKAVLHSSYWISKPFDICSNVKSKTSILALIERGGSSHYAVFEIDQATGDEVLRATYAVNVLDVVLKGQDGNEIDGQTKAVDITAFLNRTLKPRSLNQGDALTPDWAPAKSITGPDTADVVVSPYIGGSKHDDILFSAFDPEFQFTLPLEKLKDLKTVEATLSSKNNVPVGK